MGRALLIITLGSFIVLGIIQQAVNNRQITMTDGNIETYMVSHGRNMTGSALEMVISKLIHDNDWDWESETQPLLYTINDMDVNVWMETDEDDSNIQPGFIRIQSSLQLPNRQISSSAYLRLGTIEMLELEGALVAYDDGSSATIRGSGDSRISGFDTNPGEVEGSGPAEDLPGIVGTITESEFVNQKGGGGTEAYYGDPPYLQNEELDGTELDRLVKTYKEMGTYVTDVTQLGSPESPRISIIDGEHHYNGGSGSGIMVITEGSEFLITGGNFTFEGMVIVMGKFENRGNTIIYGGIALTDNSLLDLTGSEAPGVEFRGTTHVYYSSQALENVKNRLGGGGSGAIVNRILY